tara:strand:- start:344 stop:1000 length:657 start_codon:yes stop_codon:yes gene_type:complete
MQTNKGRPYCLVWDVETQQKINDMPGRFREDRIKKLSISVACALVLDSELVLNGKRDEAMSIAQHYSFWCDDVSGFQGLLTLMDNAEVICAYNGICFDHLVLHKHYNGDRTRELSHTAKAHDVFRAIIGATGSRWPKLADLLRLNGLAPKEADGLLAIQWWSEQRRDDLESYCASDVRLFAELLLQREGIILPDEDIKAPVTLVGLAPAIVAQRFKFP